MQHFSKCHTCEKIETMLCWRAEHEQIAPQHFSLSTKDKPEALRANFVKGKTDLQSTGLLGTTLLNLNECGSQSPNFIFISF